MINSSLVTTSKFPLQPSTDKELWLVFDIETNGLYDDVTDTFCVVCHDLINNQTHKFKPDQVNQALQLLSKADVLIGHNILFYDLPVLNKLYKITFSARIIDTLVCTRLIWPKEVLYDLDDELYQQVPIALKGSASLKAWGYRLSNHKIDFKDFSEYSQEMLDYCVQDVMVTCNLLKYIIRQNYSQPALKLEHEFAIFIQKQIREGIPFDIDAALDLVDVLRTKQTRLEEQLQQKYGWTPERTTEKGNPILDDEILGKLPYPEASTLAEYMLIKKRLGQISEGNNAWLKLVNNDTGRMHGNVITNGCITARCSHKSPNLGQVVASYSPYGKECRSLFHAPYDWDQIGVDAKALELRCLAGYLAYWDDGEYAALVVNPEVDIHTYNQEQFGVPTRDIAKRLLYGMLYGCGAAKAGTIIDPNEKDPEKLKTMGRDAINSFLVGVPALRKLKTQVEETIAERGYLLGLDKRALHCRSAFKGLNVLLQSAGALLMKQVVININQNIASNLNLDYGLDWYQMLMIHDEVQLACKPEHTKAIQKESLDAFPQAQEFFGFKCKIEGDSKVGSNWAETH